MKIAGIILAGGQSRRMGGNEKSLMDISGFKPIELVAHRLTPQVDIMAINANGDAGRFSHIECPVIEDTVDGNVGPLAGVLAGMRWASEAGCQAIATAATDTPFFPKDLVSRLASARQDKIDIAMAKSGERIHPVFAIWPVALADELESFLVEEDKRKILEFANRYTLHEIEFAIDDIDPFFNINTPEDAQMAHSILEAAQK